VAAACSSDHTDRPNVILVSIDTLRADALGSYGGVAETPALDALAAQGVLFERAYAPTALTAPSHTSLLTGTDPLQHGVVRNGLSLSQELELVGEAFQEAGYASGAFVSSFVLDTRFGWAQGFDVYDSAFSEEEATLPKERGNPGVFFRMHDFGGFDRRANASIDAALAWLERAPEPYFLFVHLFDPHDPYMPPKGFRPRLRGLEFDLAGRRVPDFSDPDRLRRVVRRYHAEVLYTDEELGRLLRAAARKSDRRRLTAITADHGEGLGQHDWLFHAMNLYQEALHVPLIIHDSAATTGGTRLATPVGVIDVAPTLLELAGLPPLRAADGISLADAVRRGSEPLARPVFAYRREHKTHPAETRGEMLAVRDGDWKLIRRVGHAEELYDLATDPRELDDRLGRAAQDEPERLEALRGLLDSYAAGRAGDGEIPELGEEVRAALEVLGYTD
jgi:arylsulfatase A-like enzyme